MKVNLTLLLCLFTLSTIGQNISWSGKVLDEDEAPLVGASIFIPSIEKGELSDASGNFEFKNLKRQQFKAEVSYLGKESQILNVDLSKIKNSIITLISDINTLDAVIVNEDRKSKEGISRLKAVEDMAIYASKKSELIYVDKINFNKAANTSRQVYAKVSGLNIWESDGAGVQLGIGGRGLSPNRNSNFNTRQNGYDISADPLGYPESYYSPPLEAIERIEIVRGAASLQYGTQFGGMLNFKFKKGSKSKKVALSSRQTVGSFGLFNSFNSLGGTIGKINYYGYKRSDGWRPNSNIEQHSGHLSMNIPLNSRISIHPEFTHTDYLAQQPGGLTDAEFEIDPRQSNRSRNWFKVNWNLFALNLDYKVSPKLRFNSQFFALAASRDALGNLDPINLIDFGLNRDYLSDEFNNWGNESRLLFRYNLKTNPSTLLLGFRYYNGRTLRKQGEGDDGNGPNFEYLNPSNLEGSDFRLPNTNVALFAENVWNINSKWSITPGFRYEFIKTSTNGYYRNIAKDLAGNIILDERIEEAKTNPRSFLFFGIGTSYKFEEDLELYANFSQNYRAITFNDIRVNVGSLVVDENLKDERGFNLDIGGRGKLFDFLDFDVSLYHLAYKDRIGVIFKREPNPAFNNLVDRIIRFRSNIADANIFGLESVLQFDLKKIFDIKSEKIGMNIFTNLSLTSAYYKKSENAAVEGNEVELVPRLIFKSGLNFNYKKVRISAQYSYTGFQFSDASNAIITSTAIEGIIPAYSIFDLSMSYTKNILQFEFGLNNILDRRYFTRRASGYPGPGIIPSDGRSLYLTIGLNL
jgi:Fe(3+) dicitrate transport protein